MSTFYSNRTTANAKPKAVEGMGGMIADSCTLTLTEWSSGDLFFLFWIPKGATLLKWYISVNGQVDSNVSPTSTVQIGTLDSVARFMSSTAFGQTTHQTLGDFSANAVSIGVLPYIFSTTQISTSGFLRFATSNMLGAVKPDASIVNVFTA